MRENKQASEDVFRGAEGELRAPTLCYMPRDAGRPFRRDLLQLIRGWISRLAWRP